MNLLTILLQAEMDGQTGNQWGFWIMMIAVFVIMWLFMIRPQQKKQKELEKQRNEMKAGDKVVTAGGIHGKIDKVHDDTFSIEIAKGITINVDKSSVFAEAAPEKKEEKKENKKKDEEKRLDD